MADRYEIREEIGKGGLGAVYRAFDTQLQRDVAMKRVLTTDHGSQEEVQKAADNLLAEAQTLSTLNHPNIVTVFDVGQDDKGGFVVMELLKGETIDDTVARGVLTQEDFIEVVSQTMEALIAAQAANVLHRDLKPTNVMVIWQASGKFQTKILDFGLAKLTKTPSVQTMDQDDAVMGSIYFMAPEQFERGELDERTDMYAIGCVYYFALTGQYPFRGETAPQVMNAHLQHRVTALEKLRPDLSPSICQWVMWLINRKMENRPATARDALERFPKNPEAPGQAQEKVMQAIPVEELPGGMTTSVHVVAAPAAGAAPPSGMVITHHPDGSVSQQLVVDRPAPATPQRKLLKILLAISTVVLLTLIGFLIAGKITTTKEAARLATLAGKDEPSGTVADIDLAMKYLIDRKQRYGAEQKKQAREILMKLEGQGVEDRLIDLLKSGNAPTSSARIYLSQSLAERDSTKAVPVMLDVVARIAKEPEKKVILGAVRGIATDDHAGSVLDALGGNHSSEVRSMFENILLAIYSRKPRNEENLGPLLRRVSTTSGDERSSLFRVLGTLGGKVVLTRLKSIFSDDGKQADQDQAMIALLFWQDRAVVPILENIIANSKSEAQKSAAARALARVVSLPAPGKPEQHVELWKKALALTTKGSDAQRILIAIVDMPTPQSRQLINDLKKDPKFKALAENYEKVFSDVSGRAKDVSPSELLKATGADQIRGDFGGVAFDDDVQAFVNWRLPETWFSFHFKVREAGSYDVEVLQSYVTEGSSQFWVVLADKAAIGEAKPTLVWEDYKPVKVELGVDLEAGKVYTLYLRAKGVTQPRMMNVKGVKLIKR